MQQPFCFLVQRILGGGGGHLSRRASASPRSSPGSSCCSSTFVHSLRAPPPNRGEGRPFWCCTTSAGRLDQLGSGEVGESEESLKDE